MSTPLPRLHVAHISDLHVGKGADTAQRLTRLAVSLAKQQLDWVVCTGDVTDHGQAIEAAAFARAMKGIAHKLTVIPGNHDRLNDNPAKVLSKGDCWVREGCGGRLRLVCIDSTHPANAALIMADGELTHETIDRAVAAAKARGIGQSTLVLLHHHLVKAGGDDLLEVFSDAYRLPFANCLKRGRVLARLLTGEAAGVLHGHKHKAAFVHFREGPHVLPVINAGSTTALLEYRVLVLDDNQIVGERWVKF